MSISQSLELLVVLNPKDLPNKVVIFAQLVSVRILCGWLKLSGNDNDIRDCNPAAIAIAPDITKKPTAIREMGRNAIPRRRSAGSMSF